MTPHENMLLTIKAMEKRKEIKKKKAQWDVASYINTSTLKAMKGHRVKTIF